MGFKWRDDYTEKFLEIYKDQECLWNVNNCNYKNKSARNAAYMNIITYLNIPGVTITDIKNKIKIIRTNYKSELNKIIKSEESADGLESVYVPSVFWFKLADSFLRGVSGAKESTSNLVHSRNVEVVEQLVTYPFIESYLQETTDYSESPSGNEYQEVPMPSTMHYDSPRIKKPRLVKKRTLDIDAEENEDEFDYFGKSIAVQLRKMPLDRALFTIERLQAVMREERLYQLKKCQQHDETFSLSSSLSNSSLYNNEPS